MSNTARGLLAAALAACATHAHALDAKVSGRVVFGATLRTEAPDPDLMVSYNAAAVGLTGLASAGQNTDDQHYNFARGDATTRVLKGYLDLNMSEGDTSALVRVKAWHDFALKDHARVWGNSINGYLAGQPLDDRGAARLSRFSGVALGDAFVQQRLGAWLLRLGQQSLNWGERAVFPGGLSGINAIDAPALRRAAPVPQEFRIPAPMAFARFAIDTAWSAEAFWQAAFRPSAQDLCGTFWAATDYMADGCNYAFAGAPAANDRARLLAGAYVQRMDSPTSTGGKQFGAALHWKGPVVLGLYYARYTSRIAMPGLRKTSRSGPGVIAGDPDGQNMRFFTEYVGGIEMFALTGQRRSGPWLLHGEVAVRPRHPFALPASDVLPAFLNPALPALLRAEANAVAPGGIFHAVDRYRTTQLQLGGQREWKLDNGIGLTAQADLVAKHAHGLPDPAVRRYGRTDQFGVGPVRGVCTVTSSDAARQCTLAGYITPTSTGYRLRLEAARPGASIWAAFSHDLKGWSYDYANNEGRKTLSLGVRAEYRKRYMVEAVFSPIWGGVYNALKDHDQLALAAGIRF